MWEERGAGRAALLMLFPLLFRSLCWEHLLPFCPGHLDSSPRPSLPPLCSYHLPPRPPLNLRSSHRKISIRHPGRLPRGGEAWKSVSKEAMTSEVRYPLWGLSPTYP